MAHALNEFGRSPAAEAGTGYDAPSSSPAVLWGAGTEAPRRAAAAALRRAGYRVLEAASGGEAVRLLEQRPALVLLDVSLPDLVDFLASEPAADLKARGALIAVVDLQDPDTESAEQATAQGGTGARPRDHPLSPAGLVEQVKALLPRAGPRGAPADAEALLTAVLEASPDAIFTMDRDGRLTGWNPAAERLYGYPAGQAVGRLLVSLGPPECAGELAALVESLRQGSPPPPTETLALTRDGRRVEVELALTPVHDPAGRLTGGVGLCRAVAGSGLERLLTAQQAVTRVLAGAGSLREAAPAILDVLAGFAGWDVGLLWTVDANAGMLHCVHFWQRPGLEIAGRSVLTRPLTLPAELAGSGDAGCPVGVAGLLRGADFPRRQAATDNGLAGGAAFLILYEGETIGVLEFLSKAIRQPAGELLALMEDLGSQIGQFMARVRAEQEVQKRERQYWQLFHEDLTGAFLATPQGDILLCNAAFARIFGCASLEEAMGLSYLALFADRREGERALACLRRDRALPASERVLVRPDGQAVRVVERLVGWWDPDGRLVQLQGHLHDVTERTRAEEALRQERDFAEKLVQSAQVVVLALDREGRVVRYNPFLEELSGYPQAQAQGRDGIELFFAAAERATMRALFDQARAGASPASHHCQLRTRQGGRREIDWRLRALWDAEGGVTGVLLIGHDIAELRQAQERALQVERLAAVGEMVAVLAHESRNALQGSQACLEMLRWRLAGQPEALQLVGKLQKQQERLHRLHEDLRCYVAPLVLKCQGCDLAAVWRKAWSGLLAVRPGVVARLEEECDRLDLRCRADPFRLEQVFRNLLENALDACGSPARVVIRCSLATHRAAPAVQVTVRDDGPGLTAEQRQHLFQPFYTTKTRGTGLGLAISKRIVEAHGGEIGVGGGPPGAEIVVLLPGREP